MIDLFQKVDFKSHAGLDLKWKMVSSVDCMIFSQKLNTAANQGIFDCDTF